MREQSGGCRDQRNSFVAAWLGWAMDAFDYFLLVFVITDVADTFEVSKTKVAVATTLTLAARPVGAAIFGSFADQRGRRPALFVCVLFYSTVGVLTAFSTSLTMLLVLRALYGIGMGGEWGLGASLAMEKIPPAKRGFYSGVLQQGYPASRSSSRRCSRTPPRSPSWRPRRSSCSSSCRAPGASSPPTSPSSRRTRSAASTRGSPTSSATCSRP